MNINIYKNSNTFPAFTLAELLVAMLVIGVLAAFTIPPIIQNTQEAHLKTAWKKSYSDFAQAVEKMKIDKGGSLDGNGYIWGSYFLPYLDYIEDCASVQKPGICWHNALEWSRLNGNKIASTWSENNPRAVMLKNGTLIAFAVIYNGCVYQIGTSNNYACNRIYIDVNGFKKPNIIGKDIFGLWVLKDRIIPIGTQYENLYIFTDCNQPPNPGWTAVNNQGLGCSARALKE